jgi:transcriptional regulator with XRE-family HTH domain
MYNEKIKALRIKKRIKQVDVARAAGIKQSSYASIENGDTKAISIDIGKGIAKALGVSFNELFDIELQDVQEHEKQIKETEQLKKRILELEKINNLQEQVNQNLKDAILEAYDWASYKGGGIEAFLKVHTVENGEPSEFQLFIRDFYRRLISRGCITRNDIDSYLDNQIVSLNKKLGAD